MLLTDTINLKPFICMLSNCGFKRCTLWHEKEYLMTHTKTRMWKSHMIASRKIDILHSQGLPYSVAQKWVLLEGNQNVTKKNLALFGKPIFHGTLEELSKICYLWNEDVCDFHISGIFRNRIEIILKDPGEDTHG
jgi:hypothetical protein